MEQQRYQQARRVTLIGAGVNVLLGIVKVIAGIYGNSQALLADGIHSFSDLITDALVLFASRFGSRDADHDHPYGHGRIETAATMGLALLLILVGIGIIYEGSHQIIWHNKVISPPNTYVLGIALISIIVNEILFYYTLRVSQQLKSKLLAANAWHHRSDAASSLIVLLGVAGALLGYVYLDAVAAIIVGFMIIKMGGKLAWSSIQELVDTGLSNEHLAAIRRQILTIPGIEAIHQLRTRSMGSHILVDVHILVKPLISVSEGHYLSQQVHYQLQQNFPNVYDVTVHVDPEDDEVNIPNLQLPLRPQVLSLLQQRWQGLPGFAALKHIDLHYVNGKIDVNIMLPLQDLSKQQAQLVTERYRQAMVDLPEYGLIQVFFFCEKE